MIIFKNDLRTIDEEGMELLKKYFRGYDYRGASYTFISNYIWKDSFCLSWEIIEDYLCLGGSRCSQADEECGQASEDVQAPEGVQAYEDAPDVEDNKYYFMAMPMVLSPEDYKPETLKKVVKECKRRFEEAGKVFMISAIPGHMKHILEDTFGDKIEFFHDDAYDEYVYLKEKLITLSGRALHKKKNHLNFFLRNYEYEVKPIREVDPKDILALAAEIRDYKAQDQDEEEDIEAEYEAIEQLLAIMAGNPGEDLKPCGLGEDECPIYGVGVYINDKLEAFAIGEIITEEYACEHFEKANDSYRGLYQLVCSEFCKALPESVIFVNREEDMGLPGLRQAKEALKPEYMEERFAATIDILK